MKCNSTSSEKHLKDNTFQPHGVADTIRGCPGGPLRLIVLLWQQNH